jgi:hypothetical protein
MTILTWLVILVIIAAGFYARWWQRRPSDMPEILVASYAYQTLEFLQDAALVGKDAPGENRISESDTLKPYLRKRKLAWRQRRDVIGYMMQVDWLYEFNNAGIKSYQISRTGRQEAESADGLRGAVRGAAESLHDEGITSDQARTTAAAIIAAAVRVDAVSAPSKSRQSVEASAAEAEEAVKTRDQEQIDRKVTRIKDVLQIATYSWPFVREIMRILGM